MCHRQNLFFWNVALTLMGLDAAWLLIEKIPIPSNALITAGGALALMGGLSYVYTYCRPDERLANFTGYAALLMAYSISLGVFGYLMAGFNFPLIDQYLNQIDLMLGFNWPALYQSIEAHPFIKKILGVAYASVTVQIGVLVMVLITLKDYARLHRFVGLYIASSLLFVLISGFLPAGGAFLHYQTALDTPYVQQFLALRSHALQQFDLFKLQGVVQFPSFHLALALLCTYAARGLKFWFPLFLALNCVVAIATPTIGGHFLVDLLAGALLTMMLIYVAGKLLPQKQDGGA